MREAGGRNNFCESNENVLPDPSLISIESWMRICRYYSINETTGWYKFRLLIPGFGVGDFP